MCTSLVINHNLKLLLLEVGLLSLQSGSALTILVEADSQTRIILVPSFAKTGMVVLLCLETLECRTIGFEVPSWVGEMNGYTRLEEDDEGDVKME